MEQGQVPLQEKNSQEMAVQQLLHLDTAPADENDLIIFIEGVYQNQDAYSVSGTTLTMADAPVSGRGSSSLSSKCRSSWSRHGCQYNDRRQ